MRLEGTLDAFSLPDIFQLLSSTKKTGTLHLRRELGHGAVHLRDGKLTGARSDVRRQALARRMVGAGLVDDDKLADAVEQLVDEPLAGLGKVLAGALDEKVAANLAGEQVTDAVFELLRWNEGDFAFVDAEIDPDDLGVALSVDEVVAEGKRRLENWTELTASVPDPEALVAFAPAPTEPPVLSTEEWQLLQLVDGRRTVSDLVQLSGRGDYALVSMLAGMVDRGLLVVSRPADGDALSRTLRRQNLLAALEGMPLPADPDEPQVPTAAAVPAADPVPPPATVAPPAAVAAEPARQPTKPAAKSVGAPSIPAQVIPARPEPFTPARRPDHPEPAFARAGAGRSSVGSVDGSTALQPDALPVVERDPSVNKSLLLRLIAGVRGL
ncbi:MAG: hypothetical protein JWL64_2504 [Frankiales bacterium]|nr:hypothetical protein [Frankiales bacterium]